MTLNDTVPLYFGRKLHRNEYLSFISGGSGDVLNSIAVYILYTHIKSGKCLHNLRTSQEDVMVAYCLKQAGVLPMDMLDKFDMPMLYTSTPHEAHQADKHSTSEWRLRYFLDKHVVLLRA